MKQLKDKRHLITKYCEGNLNSWEQQVIQRWMDAKSANKDKAYAFLRLYRHSKAADAYDNISHERAFGNVKTIIHQIKRKRRLLFIRNIAATLIIGLCIIAGGLKWLHTSKEQRSNAGMQVIQPGSSKATLILGNGEQLILDELNDSVIITNWGAQVKKEGAELNYEKSQLEKEEINILRTPRGGEYTLLLADGTKVWLNAQSELKYPVTFIGNKREVSLSGEAYMEVAHNPDKPFIVHTNRGAVEVLGTTFNIKAYNDEEQMATTLVEGEVRLSDKKGETIILKPSMQGIVTDNNKIELKDVDVSLYTSWKDGMFTYRNQTLGQIIDDFSRWYDFEFLFESNQLKNIRFTAEIERYKNPEPLLKVLEKTNEVKFEYKKGILLIK